MKRVSLISIILAIGCGDGAGGSELFDENYEDYGDGGSSIGGSGGENAGHAGNSGETGISFAGNGGSENGGSESGGSGGDYLGDGGSENIAGAGNAGGIGANCVPKNCLTIAVELAGTTENSPEACGILDDGCGNYIDCGGCSTFTECGMGEITLTPTGLITEPGIDNLCGGGCGRINVAPGETVCGGTFSSYFYCSVIEDVPPVDNIYCERDFDPRTWCCRPF